MKLTIGLLLSVTLVSACMTTGPNNCAGWRPIVLAPESIDGLTEQDAREILSHNEFWQAECGK